MESVDKGLSRYSSTQAGKSTLGNYAHCSQIVNDFMRICTQAAQN